MHDRSAGTDSVPNAGSGTPEHIQETLATCALAATHNVAAFDCVRSSRVNDFIHTDHRRWIDYNYCRVFVFENPDNSSQIWGYYTLSAALLVRDKISTQHQKKAIPGIPVPLIRIGFMGRDKSSPKELGAALIVDAARRVSMNKDIAAWGLILDSEGGTDNPTLMERYEALGFRRAKVSPSGASKAELGIMYGPLKSLMGRV